MTTTSTKLCRLDQEILERARTSPVKTSVLFHEFAVEGWKVEDVRRAVYRLLDFGFVEIDANWYLVLVPDSQPKTVAGRPSTAGACQAAYVPPQTVPVKRTADEHCPYCHR